LIKAKYGLLNSKLNFLKQKRYTPISVQWELTNKCNLDCIHCLRDKRDVKELNTDEVKDIITQLKKENCLGLTFTGGELFLRKDVFDIIEFARQSQFRVIILTNGTLLNEDKIKRLKRLNITIIQVSLHGITPSMHDSITQVKGSFAKTMNAISLFRKYKIPFRVATMALNKNFDQLKALKRLAHKQKWEIIIDFSLAPTFLREKYPLNLRTADKQVRQAYKQRILKWPNRQKSRGSKSKRRIHINSAKLYSSYISAHGDVYASIYFRKTLGNLRKQSLNHIWHHSKTLNWMRNLKKEEFDCYNCKYYNSCCWCAHAGYLEQGDIRKAPKQMCRINRIVRECNKS